MQIIKKHTENTLIQKTTFSATKSISTATREGESTTVFIYLDIGFFKS